jgi:hypothetical protein
LIVSRIVPDALNELKMESSKHYRVAPVGIAIESQTDAGNLASQATANKSKFESRYRSRQYRQEMRG